MSLIFVDTSAWFASVVRSDRDHGQASRWLQSNRSDLLTTDYVLDELLTLLRFRGEYRRSSALGNDLLNETVAQLEWVTQSDVHLAWEVFERYADKEWSFTDCVSRTVMERLGITRAFAFDEHFRQFGSVTVVP